MTALTFILALREPLLATQPFSGEADSRSSFPYIPGSMIRGALIRAGGFARSEEDLMLNEKMRRLFFEESVRFLNAYPTDPSTKQRTLPTPCSWFLDKDLIEDEQAPVYDFAVQINGELESPKPPKEKFCKIVDQNAFVPEVKFQITVHNAGDDRNVKGENNSQVFRYEALAPDQDFSGVILAKQEANLLELQALLESRFMTLGGAHTGGYGKVEIKDVKLQNGWEEYQTNHYDEDNAEKIVTFTLLSDAVLRSGNGQTSLDFAKALGINRPDKDDQYRAYAKVHLIGGFNRKWGMPLPQSWVLSGGSVFRCPASAIDANALRAIIEEGIGERRVEGFGRVAVNWQTQQELKKIKATALPKSFEGTLSTQSQKLAERMATRRLRFILEEQLVKMLDKIFNKFPKRLPTSAQLSRVRVAARDAFLTPDLSKITKHMDFIKDHGAKEDWERTCLEGIPLFDWIKDHCKLTKEQFEEKFELSGKLPKIAGKMAVLDDDLRAEFCARYIDGVMRLGIRENKKREEKYEVAMGE